jgi:hypothetical protein
MPVLHMSNGVDAAHMVYLHSMPRGGRLAMGLVTGRQASHSQVTFRVYVWLPRDQRVHHISGGARG